VPTYHRAMLKETPVLSPTYRYPFAPYPDGWYLLRESAAVNIGDVVPLHYFGRDLVLFRNESGRAVVFDAHCPHMGAHLGYGGTVEGEGIRCPFHSWRFAADGACDDVPYSHGPTPTDVCIPAWPVFETSGLILVWFSESADTPSWHPLERPEWEMPGWLGYETVGWTIRMHVQELAENVPDMAHFHYVHGVGDSVELRADVETDGPFYRQRSLVTIDGVEREFARQEAHGLGLVWLLAAADPAYWLLTATTPIDDERVEMRLLFLMHQADDATELSPAALAAVESTAENVARDVSIWEHKVYRERAPLVAGDGPIGVLRKWARQFYAT
jgi:3-ketosteroid 9alpha-monooxygenase subunit A